MRKAANGMPGQGRARIHLKNINILCLVSRSLFALKIPCSLRGKSGPTVAATELDARSLAFLSALPLFARLCAFPRARFRPAPPLPEASRLSLALGAGPCARGAVPRDSLSHSPRLSGGEAEVVLLARLDTCLPNRPPTSPIG